MDNCNKHYMNFFNSQQNAKQETTKKIKEIIQKEFDRELHSNQIELCDIDKRLSEARKMMHHLRACIIATYYTSPIHGSVHPACLQYNPQVQSINELPAYATNTNVSLATESASLTSSETYEDPFLENTPFPNTEFHDGQMQKIIIGNVSKYIHKSVHAPDDPVTHKWMIYVRGPREDPRIDHIIQKVVFFLHPSYKPNDIVEVSSIPFHLTRHGWGEFPVRIQLHFHGSRQKKVDVIHHLELDKTYTGLQTLGSETVIEVDTADLDIAPCNQFFSSRENPCHDTLKRPIKQEIESDSEMTIESCEDESNDPKHIKLGTENENESINCEKDSLFVIETNTDLSPNTNASERNFTNPARIKYHTDDVDCEKEITSLKKSDPNKNINVQNSRSEIHCVTNTLTHKTEFVTHNHRGKIDSKINYDCNLSCHKSLGNHESESISGSDSVTDHINYLKNECVPKYTTSDIESIKIRHKNELHDLSDCDKNIKQDRCNVTSSVTLYCGAHTLPLCKTSRDANAVMETRCHVTYMENSFNNEFFGRSDLKCLERKHTCNNDNLMANQKISGHESVEVNTAKATSLLSTIAGPAQSHKTESRNVTIAESGTGFASLLQVHNDKPIPTIRDATLGEGKLNKYGEMNTSERSNIVHAVSFNNCHPNNNTVPFSIVPCTSGIGHVQPFNSTSVSSSKMCYIIDSACSGILQNMSVPTIQSHNVILHKPHPLHAYQQEGVKTLQRSRLNCLKFIPDKLHTGNCSTNEPSLATSSVQHTFGIQEQNCTTSVRMKHLPHSITGKHKVLVLKRQPPTNIPDNQAVPVYTINTSSNVLPHVQNDILKYNSISNSKDVKLPKCNSNEKEVVHLNKRLHLTDTHDNSMSNQSHKNLLHNRHTPNTNKTVSIQIVNNGALESQANSNNVCIQPNMVSLLKPKPNTNIQLSSVVKSNANLCQERSTEQRCRGTAHRHDNVHFTTLHRQSPETVNSDNIISGCCNDPNKIIKTSTGILELPQLNLNCGTVFGFVDRNVLDKSKNLLGIKRRKETQQELAPITNKLNSDEDTSLSDRLLSITDFEHLLKSFISQFPLISEDSDRSIHPYCASSLDQWLSWPPAKKRAFEWLRAVDIRRHLQSVIKASWHETVSDNDIWTTKDIMMWCRKYAYSPHYFDVLDICSTVTDACIQQESTHTYTDISLADSVISMCKRGTTSWEEQKTNISEEETIDILSIDNPLAVQSKTNITHSTRLLIMPVPSACFVQDLLSKLRFRFEPVVLDDDYCAQIVEEMIFKLYILFMEDLLRSSFSALYTSNRLAEILTTGDVLSAITTHPEFNILTNAYLGKIEQLPV